MIKYTVDKATPMGFWRPVCRFIRLCCSRCGDQKLPGICPCKMSQDKYWCHQKILSIISLFLSEDQLNCTELRSDARIPVCSFFHLYSLNLWVCFIFSSTWLRLLSCFEGLIWKNIAEYDKIDLRNKMSKVSLSRG